MSNVKDEKSMGNHDRDQRDKDQKSATDRPGEAQRQQSTGQPGSKSGQQGGQHPEQGGQHGGQQGGSHQGGAASGNDASRKSGKV
jgi:hypothetical protein